MSQFWPPAPRPYLADRVSVAAATWTTVTFKTPFPSAPVVTAQIESNAGAAVNKSTLVWNVTTTGFDVYCPVAASLMWNATT